MKLLLMLLQALAVICLSPLISGFMRKIKNNLRMRRGAGVLQPYYDFFKLLGKEEVVSGQASWIFAAAPYAVFASCAAALLLVPAFVAGPGAGPAGDFLLVIFLLALGRFFLALAGLDAGSAFGGMGSSREMFVSSIVEPVLLLSVFAVSINNGSTGFSAAPRAAWASSVLAASALLLAMLAETSRIPVDNRETHLELTMIHEAMVLEYSGRSLALIELAAHAKQALFFILAGNMLFPPVSVPAFLLKIIFFSVVISVIEVSTAKMRLFRAVDFYSFGFLLSLAALVAAVLGY